MNISTHIKRFSFLKTKATMGIQKWRRWGWVGGGGWGGIRERETRHLPTASYQYFFSLSFFIFNYRNFKSEAGIYYITYNHVSFVSVLCAVFVLCLLLDEDVMFS